MADSAEAFRESLFDAGLLVSTGIDGLFGRSRAYEAVVAGVSAMLHSLGSHQGATWLSFPPVMAARVVEQSGFLESFPNLVGVVHGFSGSDEEHGRLLRSVHAGGHWSDELSPTGLALCSAACHPVYPMCAGRVPSGGRHFELSAQCFRHEPSLDPARMQSFRVHEYTYVGEQLTARAFRDDWVETARNALAGLGLEVTSEQANDPFFGRAGQLLADRQRRDERKIEIISSLPAYSGSTAVASCNWHEDHFGRTFGIETATGEVASSSCVGFGLDRIAVALLATHGLDPSRWPSEVQDRLGSMT